MIWSVFYHSTDVKLIVNRHEGGGNLSLTIICSRSVQAIIELAHAPDSMQPLTVSIHAPVISSSLESSSSGWKRSSQVVYQRMSSEANLVLNHYKQHQKNQALEMLLLWIVTLSVGL